MTRRFKDKDKDNGRRGRPPRSRSDRGSTPRAHLRAIARRAMLERGFLVELPADAREQLALQMPDDPRAGETGPIEYGADRKSQIADRRSQKGVRDLTSWLWSSI